MSKQKGYHLVVRVTTYKDFLKLVDEVSTPDVVAIVSDKESPDGRFSLIAVTDMFDGGVAEFVYTHGGDEQSFKSVSHDIRERGNREDDYFPVIDGMISVYS